MKIRYILGVLMVICAYATPVAASEAESQLYTVTVHNKSGTESQLVIEIKSDNKELIERFIDMLRQVGNNVQDQSIFAAADTFLAKHPYITLGLSTATASLTAVVGLILYVRWLKD